MDKVLAKDVMIKIVYTIRPKRKIALARLRMLRQGVGALPVVDDENKLVGIITLRDTDFARAYDLLVEDLMTTDLTTGRENETIEEIVDVMLNTGTERLPITNRNGKFVGLITQKTVIRVLNDLLKQQKDHNKS
jgi:IMP dehydrogenase